MSDQMKSVWRRADEEPERYGEYLVADKYLGIGVSYWGSVGWYIQEVKFWMPIPELPEEEEVCDD